MSHYLSFFLYLFLFTATWILFSYQVYLEQMYVLKRQRIQECHFSVHIQLIIEWSICYGFIWICKTKTLARESPLASRLRPTTLDEVVGQEHIVGKDKLLYRAIKADKLTSVIFYGPPGTGKTTLAKVIANTTSASFTQINATVAGKKDMEEVVKEAQDRLGMYGKKTILFIDEIHRFNKGQQDYLLPFVEDGTIILIGATTENPYFWSKWSSPFPLHHFWTETSQ